MVLTEVSDRNAMMSLLSAIFLVLPEFVPECCEKGEQGRSQRLACADRPSLPPDSSMVLETLRSPSDGGAPR